MSPAEPTQEQTHPNTQVATAMSQRKSQYKENSFCSACLPLLDRIGNILQSPEDRIRSHREEFSHHSDVHSLLLAADEGCHLCSLLLGTSWLGGQVKYSEARNGILKREGRVIIKLHGNPGKKPERPWKTSKTTSNALMQVDAGFTATDMIHCVRASVTDAPKMPLCPSTGDPEALELASFWLNRCLREHSNCITASRSAIKILPARILRLNGSNSQELRLVLLTEDEEALPYVALSYSWGSQSRDCAKLTTDNIDNFMQHIPISTLPLTIRDAVKVTRSLGYHYLWVDSLCIIQDSTEDWEDQATKMGSIYSNAVVTIAALGCSGNHESIFRNRNPLCDRPCHVPNTADWMISNTSFYFFREYEQYGSHAAPLHTRAWVVQERFSSLRTLFFGESGIFWECITCLASESDPYGRLEGSQTNFKHHVNEIRKDHEDHQNKMRHFAELWPIILQQYTLCELTFASDKLVAILGMMDLLASTMAWSHYKGLWLDILPFDMCWRSNGVNWLKEPEKGGRLENGVPTWSWASVRQPVTTAFKYHKYSAITRDSWLEHPCVVGYATSSGAKVWPTKKLDLPLDLLESLRVCPPNCISLTTQLRKVYLIHKPRNLGYRARLTLKEPPQQQVWGSVRKRPAWPLPWQVAISRYSSSKGWDPEDTRFRGEDETGFVEDYDWYPDVPLDPEITTAWFMNVLNYEGHNELKTGMMGLVIVAEDYSRRIYRRIGLLNNKVFKSADRCYNTSMLPPNPFAIDGGVIELVHIV